jgi:hypothetical protein
VLRRVTIEPPAPQLLRHCASQYHIAMSSGSCQTETEEEKEEPDHGATGCENGGHWNFYVREESGRTAFLASRQCTLAKGNACGRRRLADPRPTP